MKKQEFLNAIRKRLSGFPKNHVDEHVNFYSEIIDDKIEEGIDEEVAVSEIGTVEDISKQIIKAIPFSEIAKERLKIDRSLKTWEILLILLGSPIWISLLIGAVAVIFSLYVIVWSVIISMWAVFVSLLACGIAGIIVGVISAFTQNAVQAIIICSVGALCLGFAIFGYYCCIIASKCVVLITKKLTLALKKSFVKKEEA